MKLLSVKLFIIVFAVLGIFKSEPAFLEEIRLLEKAEKTIVLNVQKVDRFDNENTTIEMKKPTFFRIVPPLYEIIWDTINTFDKSKCRDEKRRYYKLSYEHILLKNGGFKWIEDKAILNNCTEKSTYKWLNEGQLILKYVKEPSEYSRITKLSVKSLVHYREGTDLAKVAAARQQELAIYEAAKMRLIIQRERLIKNGYLEEIREEDILQNYNPEDKIIKLEKGFWQISEKEKLVINCEATLQNIQIVLKSMGYETNTDGKETNIYREAKSLFMTDVGLNKPNKRSKTDFLIALGFEVK